MFDEKMNYKKDLKILFFGLGSIGTKHAKIIQENYNYELYAYRTKKGQERNNLKIKEFSDLKIAFSIKPDIAFITNPTYLHVPTAIKCAKRNINMFIEKPIFNSLEKTDYLEKEIKKRKLFTYVAYNMRFHPVIKKLKEISDKPIYFKIISNSYLPEWRPNQDYTKSYSAKKNQGGGVILDLSHEIDYVSWLFGEIRKIEGFCGKISDLKINCEDIMTGQVKCSSGITGKLHLDCFNPNSQRKIQIYYVDKYVEGDLLENKIKTIKNGKEQVENFKTSIDDTYREQIKYFFEQYHKNNLVIMNNYSESLKTFKNIMKFKKECNLV